MQIIKTESWILRLPFVRTSRDFNDAHHELIGVTLHTDTGETGTGFAFVTDFGGGVAVKALLDDVLLPRVQGRPVHEAKAIWHELWYITHRLGRGINSFAIAAIDIALWDLRARGNGHSLARELGQVTDRVPAYGSGKGSPLLPVDELVELSAGYVEQGFQAVKVRIGVDPAADIERVRAVRRALGDSVRIMCDANERLDLPTALWLGNRLAEFDIYWFEEPVVSDDVAAHQRLAQALPMPIVGGEHLCSSREFVQFVNAQALDVLQPNICMVGGFTEGLRIGELAAAHGLGFAPHFMSELHIHLAAALKNTTYLEYFPFLDEFIEEPLEHADGHILVPERPGHGIRFTEATWNRYRTG
ncbi:mandelate racemase/muconate lactonizing enzyme family protein [Modestobacter lapidis]|nr:mandelate racemase/muconate lactonizing enzyme family protein [Modestobacter lapidis]